MRTLIVFILALIVTVLVFWALCGFVSTIFNPMLWLPMGRFLFVLFGLFFGGLAGVGAACVYEDHLRNIAEE